MEVSAREIDLEFDRTDRTLTTIEDLRQIFLREIREFKS
jgi:hypothetical protein